MMPDNDSADDPDSPLYDLEGVSFSAGSRVIISGLTLSIAPARIHGLVGPNGSGKSTLIRMLARQLEPTGGRLRFMSKDIRDWRAGDFARSVAYMPQFTPPAEGMTVAELVALGRFPCTAPSDASPCATGRRWTRHWLTRVFRTSATGSSTACLAANASGCGWR